MDKLHPPSPLNWTIDWQIKLGPDCTDDSQRWRKSLLCFESHPCACVGQTVNAAALHKLLQRFSLIEHGLFGSGQLIISIILATATWLHTLTQKIVQFSELSHEWYLFWCYSIQTTHHKKVTIYSSFLAKSKSSSTVSKWTQQCEVFLKKESYNIWVWWSLC